MQYVIYFKRIPILDQLPDTQESIGESKIFVCWSRDMGVLENALQLASVRDYVELTHVPPDLKIIASDGK